jgi:hypothetical protein
MQSESCCLQERQSCELLLHPEVHGKIGHVHDDLDPTQASAIA